MSNKLITLERAKREKERLTQYIELIENYKADSVEKWVIKEYALSNSIKKIVENAENKSIARNGVPLNRNDIIEIINGKVMDELHRILRLGYRQKIKPNRYSDYYSSRAF